ncbi:MarR family transcriptional regulator [uncultured Tateyamaria sp.]|uniref:MarR family winged helix-turn-helix transcriptional regulator n=1 Tax=Tateyamaria sp. 1078 TaxID=3417464 RepID=UPI00262153A0|nr:MarR family transcriptional regulator [uncultured Tateyamaria sp.]
MPDHSPALFFEVFNEIGIIEQLSRALLEARLPHGLIAPHFTVLNHLTRVQDGRTPMEMARAFQLPKTSMTHTIKGLEAHGLIETRANPEDGRSKRVWLTEAGRALRADVIASLGPDLAHMAKEFDMDKLIAIKPVLTELRIYLDQARDG